MSASIPILSLHVKKLDGYHAALGPHAQLLLGELRSAATGRPSAPATVIILAAAIMDVMLHEPSGRPITADGIDIAEARFSRNTIWLRERRNRIVHYDGGQGGLMGDEVALLEKDAIRAIDTLAGALETLT